MTKTARIACLETDGYHTFTGTFTQQDCLDVIGLTPADGKVKLTNYFVQYSAATDTTQNDVIFLYKDVGHSSLDSARFKRACRTTLNTPDEWS